MMKNQAHRKRGTLKDFFRAYAKNVHANKLSFFIYTLMTCITVVIIVLTALNQQFESTFTAVISLILFLMPTFVEKNFRVELPTTLEIIAVLFVFCANILGEIGEFYTKIPFWDDLLHFTSGFIFAAFGFSLVGIFNRNTRFDFLLSPIFLSVVALCFAVTVGVVWEFFEFSADVFLHTDMQKDSIVTHIYSAELNADGQTPVVITDIVKTMITTADGTVHEVNGYLDIGLMDTMKDLFVDFCGAFLFCVFGYFYAGHSGKGRIAKQFIPRVDDGADDSSGACQTPTEDRPKQED